MVTDEMVEKAERVYWDSSSDPEGARDMRAALEAALSAAEPTGEVAGQQGRYWMTDEGRWSNWFDITFNTWVPEPGVREVRNIYATPPAPSVAAKAIEAVWKYSLVIESSVRRGDGPDQYAGVTEALRLVKEARSALSAQVQGVSKETIPQNKETLDQVAAIMLQHGTPAQRAEAIAYASPAAPAKQEG